jgi:signal transduction histidine kinase
MDRDAALELLRSRSPHERLKAAQYLAKHVDPNDLTALRAARVTESVAYVKRRLDAGIRRRAGSATETTQEILPEPDLPSGIRREIWAKAVEQVSGTLLHEIEPRIGQIREAAKVEIPDFSASRTKARLDNLERIFEGISGLRKAAATPKIEELDLALLIREIVGVEIGDRTLLVSQQGIQPLLIHSDQRLLSLAISNGLRNAIEAVENVPAGQEPHAVVITWGETEVDYWIVILDRGPGLIGPFEAAFEVGRTTKQGHSGFGLPITRQAMETLEGSATLTPAQGGGARLELRWDR